MKGVSLHDSVQDTLKVRVQNSQPQDSPARRLGLYSICSQMLRDEGLLSLYKGVLYPVAAAGMIVAGQFGVYEASRHWLGARLGESASSSHTDTILAGMLAGAAIAPLSIPVFAA